MSELEGNHKRLTILIGETDKWEHKPLYDEIVRLCHSLGIAGVTVFKGIEGYGKSSHIHTTKILTLSQDLPIMLIIVDNESKIEKLLSYLDNMVTEGLIMIDDVRVYKYTGRDNS